MADAVWALRQALDSVEDPPVPSQFRFVVGAGELLEHVPGHGGHHGGEVSGGSLLFGSTLLGLSSLGVAFHAAPYPGDAGRLPTPQE
jgi:hypothetical protein